MTGVNRSVQDALEILRVDGTPLAGRSAVVTGASSGIGRATAEALAGAGARVGLAARRVELLDEVAARITAAGGEALALPADVTDYSQTEAMIGRAEREFDGVDILINNAGVMLYAPVAEADPTDWDRMVQVNLMGALYATRAALPGMLSQGSGHIVNVSSSSGRAYQEAFSVYAATKHALGAFTNVLLREVNDQNVRVTLFEPGATASELASHGDQELLASLFKDMGGDSFEPLQAEDIAQGILWTLAAPERANVSEVLYKPNGMKDW